MLKKRRAACSSKTLAEQPPTTRRHTKRRRESTQKNTKPTQAVALMDTEETKVKSPFSPSRKSLREKAVSKEKLEQIQQAEQQLDVEKQDTDFDHEDDPLQSHRQRRSSNQSCPDLSTTSSSSSSSSTATTTCKGKELMVQVKISDLFHLLSERDQLLSLTEQNSPGYGGLERGSGKTLAPTVLGGNRGNKNSQSSEQKSQSGDIIQSHTGHLLSESGVRLAAAMLGMDQKSQSSAIRELQACGGSVGLEKFCEICTNRTSNTGDSVQVFLGGACNPTTWRRKKAIPRLESAGISYYNPQVDEWTPELVEVEARMKERAQFLFFVIGSETRSIASMIEAAELIALGRNVVLVIEPMDQALSRTASTSSFKSSASSTARVDNQFLPQEIKDLSRGRAYLRDVAMRHRVKVFECVQEGLQALIQAVASTA